jgi:hypothetical protein
VAVKRGNSTPFSPSPPGGTSRRGILRTLRLSEARSGDSEGPESTLGHPFVCVPGAIAGEVHVLPAERGIAPMCAGVGATLAIRDLQSARLGGRYAHPTAESPV